MYKFTVFFSCKYEANRRSVRLKARQKHLQYVGIDAAIPNRRSHNLGGVLFLISMDIVIVCDYVVSATMFDYVFFPVKSIYLIS